MTTRQISNDHTRNVLKDWSEKIEGVESFDELLDISVNLNRAIEFLPVGIIGDLQSKFKTSKHAACKGRLSTQPMTIPHSPKHFPCTGPGRWSVDNMLW